MAADDPKPASVDQLLDEHPLGELARTLNAGATLTPHLGRQPPARPSIRPTMDLRAGKQNLPQPKASLAPGSLPRIALAEPTETADAELAVTGVLGVGGMGKVLLGRQRSLDRDVAIKVLREDATSPENVDALVSEGRIMGSLEHPGIVPVHSLGLNDAGEPVLVMKRVEGVPWSELLGDEEHAGWKKLGGGTDRLTVHLEILMAVCNAVHYAHERGVIHRDIKPANVLVGGYGEVYLADWGIALRVRRTDGSPVAFPPHHALVGTPMCLAPEMLLGDLARITERTDVFLLGATLHELLTGRPRHRGNNVREVLQSAMELRPIEFPAEVPEALAAACNRATAARPEDRHASALEFRQSLADYQRHRGSITLAAQAREGLAELEGILRQPPPLEPAARKRLHELMTECRFALGQSLREWKDNAQAREDLATLLRAMVSHEIAEGNLQHARALLAQLEPPPGDLALKLEAAEEARGRERERLAALELLGKELDPRVGAAVRQRGLLAMGVLCAGATAALVLFDPSGSQSLVQPRAVLRLPLLTLSLLGLGVGLSRKAALESGVTRRLIAGAVATLAAVFVKRWLGLLRGESLALILTTDLVLFALAAWMMGLFLIRRLWIVAGIFLLGAVVAGLSGPRAPIAFACAITLAFLASPWVMQERPRP